MDRISRNELLQLAAPGEGPRVSLYVPLARTWPDANANPTRLRDALDAAEQRLMEGGVGGKEAERLLDGARKLCGDEEFWRASPADGLAVLIGPDSLRQYLLPFGCPETVDVENAFHLAPLMRLLTWPVEFQLLGLSANAVRLYRGTRREMSPVELLPSVPRSLEDYLRGTESDRPVRFQTAAGVGEGGMQTGLVHGGTSYKDDAHVRLQEYVQSVAKHVSKLTGHDHVPLVLAAVRELHPVFREAYPGRNLVEPALHGSPDERSESELHEQAVKLLETVHSGEVKRILDRFHQADHPHKTSVDVPEIVAAAHLGRVDSVVAAFGKRMWGTWDPVTQQASLTSSDTGGPGQTDLIDLALCETLRQGGHVCVVPQADVPERALLAAVLRW